MEKLLLMYDLPHRTKKQRRKASRFRNKLLHLGFSMLQYSIYLRLLSTQQEKDDILLQIKAFLPSEGTVRVICLSEAAYEKMELLSGERLLIENKFVFPSVIEL